MLDSLWGEEFNIKEVDPKKLISKVENPKVVVKTVDQLLKSKKTTLDEKLAIITENVKRILGKYAENTQVIRTKEELIKYFDDAIKNNIIALDTETNNSLQPITCKLMGPCLFTPGRKAAYIPINHINKDTGELLSNQLTEEDVAEQLNRLKEAQTKVLMHNGKFDYKVFKCTTGVELTVYWDTLLAAKVLDENEEAGLKEQYVKHIDPSIEKYSINHLFAGIEYAIVDPEIFALYAATDAMMTYYLYKWQEERFKLPGSERLFKIFKDVEMQVMPVTAEMELTGLEIDKEYTQKLAIKYHNKVNQMDKEIAEAISKYDDLINSWRSKPESNKRPTTYYFDTLKESPTQLDDYKELCAGKVVKGYPKNDADGKGPYKVGKSPSELLENPINLGSPSQLAILLYDIIGVKPPDPKKPRGTGEDELKAIKLPLCKLLLERRGLVKLVDAFIDSLPNEILKETGRVHAGFNQYGAKTGRYSCSEPNLQQIPAKNKEIRLMFKAADGNVLVGSDYSQQEPRCLSEMSRDTALINAYKEGKDLYAIIATKVYNNTYWDNMEHHEDGSPNPDGKKRRKKCKTLLLAITYGMGMGTIAEMLNCTYDEAKKLVDDFYAGFPTIKQWMDKLQQKCRETGYVEDLWGRRRRLPDIQKPKFEVIDKSIGSKKAFNPLIGSTGITLANNSAKVKKYTDLFAEVKSKSDAERVKKMAEAEGLLIQEWTGSIAKAERQCVNASIQGSAATLTKMAMIKIHNDSILKKLGFKLAIAVHDELIGECPKENAEEAADRLCKLMIEAAAKDIEAPFKCDPTVEESWAIEDYKNGMRGDYFDLVHDEKLTSDEALQRIRDEHSEASDELFNEIFADIVA